MDDAVSHFENHAPNIMRAKGVEVYNFEDYINEANHVIHNGQFIEAKNAYYMQLGTASDGAAYYGYVGLERGTTRITTFHYKNWEQLQLKLR